MILRITLDVIRKRIKLRAVAAIAELLVPAGVYYVDFIMKQLCTLQTVSENNNIINNNSDKINC